MRILFSLNWLLVRGLFLAAALLIAAAMLGICFEVMLRMLGKGSISGMMEGTEYALFFSTFFAAPYLLRENQHIHVDIVTARLPDRLKAWCDYFVFAVVMAIALVLFVIGARILEANYSAGFLVFKDIVFPRWWLDWVIPLSAVAIAVQGLEKLLALRRQRLRAEPGM
jgi:TRAP-type C4-dicarboxylate transport system permease small subunit